jgi:hypothetical protein
VYGQLQECAAAMIVIFLHNEYRCGAYGRSSQERRARVLLKEIISLSGADR